MTSDEYPIVIAGAGPVGLFLAGELALAGVRSVVLEKSSNLEDPWKDSPMGRRLLNHNSTEIFYRRGLLPKVMASEMHAADLKLAGDPGGQQRQKDSTQRDRTPGDAPFASHFAGIVIHSKNVDWSQWKHILPGPSAFGGGLNQGQLTGVLYERAIELGVKVIFDCAVTSFEDPGNAVKVWTESTNAQSGQIYGDAHVNGNGHTSDPSYVASYFIGADGGRSATRRNGGFTFAGTEPSWVGYMADCTLTEESNAALPPGFHRTAEGAYAIRAPTFFALDFSPGSVAERGTGDEPLSRDQFQKILRRVSGYNDIVIDELRLAGSFTDRAKLVTQYRNGRVLLAGDAAHVHSPMGGHGLNLGLAEAISLGWRLAAVINGNADDSLLDTYHVERWPIANEAMETLRAHTAAMQPGLQGEAVHNIIEKVIATREGSTLFAGMFMWFKAKIEMDGQEDNHWLAGLSAPDFSFVDGTRLGQLLVTGKWVLVDFGRSEDLAQFAKAQPGWVYTSSEAKDTLGVAAALVRPDGVLVWATDDEETGKALPSLRKAAGKWLKLRKDSIVDLIIR